MRWTTTMLAGALVLGALATGASGASRDRTPPAAARAAWQAQRERLGRGLREQPVYGAIDDWGSYADIEAAGDLDGDGKGDVVDVRGHLQYDEALGMIETVRLEARRGTTGAALWSVAVPPASFVFTEFTKVGVDGKPGVLVIAYRDNDFGTDVSSTGAFDTTVYSFNGAGVPLWARPLPGSWAGSLPGFAVADTGVNGLFDAVAGGGTDLLVQGTAMGGAGDPTGTVGEGGTAAVLGVLDGATGAVKPLGQVFQSTWDTPFATPVGDLNKDKLADVVVDVTSDSGDSTLTAVSSAEGKTLWTRPKFATEGYREFVALPDATGDGVADVGVEVESYGSFSASAIVFPVPSSGPGPQAVLVDGASGKVLWRKSGTRLIALGNADGRAGSELLVGANVDSANHIGFTVAAYTASGKRLWTTTRKLRASGNKDYYSSWGAFADFDGDGVLDVGYAVRTGTAKSQRDEGSIDGRTGRVTKDPVPDMYGSRAAFDGRGADAFLVTSKSGVFTFDAWRGDAPKRLWTTALRVGGKFGTTEPTTLDGDKCGDVVVALYQEGSYVDVAYSGGSGTPLWVLTRSGDAAGTLSKAAVTRHKVYQRSC